MKKRFQGRVAFITGGGQGIGKAITEEFAAQGAKVAVIDSNETVLVKTAEELTGKGYDVYTKVANVVDPEEVETAMNEVVMKSGSLDILVNNAGILRDNLLFKMTDHDWQAVMDVHLKGAFNASRAAQKHMVDQQYGRIINLSSTSALDRKSTRLNSSHVAISYAVFCLKK